MYEYQRAMSASSCCSNVGSTLFLYAQSDQVLQRRRTEVCAIFSWKNDTITMSANQEASPLATLCYKAGSTLHEVLALEEEELVELSKEIVGNNVLDHARVIK